MGRSARRADRVRQFGSHESAPPKLGPAVNTTDHCGGRASNSRVTEGPGRTNKADIVKDRPTFSDCFPPSASVEAIVVPFCQRASEAVANRQSHPLLPRVVCTTRAHRLPTGRLLTVHSCQVGVRVELVESLHNATLRRRTFARRAPRSGSYSHESSAVTNHQFVAAVRHHSRMAGQGPYPSSIER